MIINIITGYLGSGKTTLIHHLVSQLSSRERVAVLVGEFGEVGIDGALLAQDAPDVLELGCECIYCTLSADLARQIPYVASSLAPDRLIIEYPGVAAVQGLLAAAKVMGLHLTEHCFSIVHVIDACNFEELYSRSPFFTESQICRANVLVLNKCDLIPENKVRALARKIKELNNRAHFITAHHGQVDPAELEVVSQTGFSSPRERKVCRRPQSAADIPNYYGFSRRFQGVFSRTRLTALFENLSTTSLGEIVRAKGIFKCEEGWMRLDYLPSCTTLEPLKGRFHESRILVIGSTLAAGKLTAALLDCLNEEFPAHCEGNGNRRRTCRPAELAPRRVSACTAPDGCGSSAYRFGQNKKELGS
ncbi:GTPase, G3E family [Desulfofundulus australicus DSM 11792]|uniref:GTPase, G3E family n=1 Tax=Desulfofundulus australicus DSM 11792 TaxID=1121425 RepID=A0A1M4Z9P6_9FIRM|nr:GTP-binding protein [Desulfofundulus australicus]SHF14760.1 GTPase, G3E family [Desulfofundulus australicus DSM 11792]